MNFKDKIPSDVIEIFKLFRSYQDDSIRLVGGCVRDLIVGTIVNDYDFASIFTPIELTKIANQNNLKVIPTGIDFGTVTILFNGKPYEVTSLRKEFNYDGRKPEVVFGTNYLDDSKRRDFTINSLYIDQNIELIDYQGGIEDIKNNKLRFIGNPEQRINEDHLRILRYFRFLCSYNNNIDQESFSHCVKNIDLIKSLTNERIVNEINKMFDYQPHKIAQSLQLIKDNNIDQHIFCSKISIHRLKNFAKLENYNIIVNKNLKLYSIFQADEYSQFLTNYNFPRSFKKYNRLIKQVEKEISSKKVNYLVTKYGSDILIDYFIYQFCTEHELQSDKLIDKIIKIQNIKVPEFPVDGDDIIKLGYEAGPKIGEILDILIDKWCQSDFSETKENLLNFAKLFKKD